MISLHYAPAGTPAVLSRTLVLAYAHRMERDPDDTALMERYRTGDIAAFEALYRRHKDPLYRYLLRLCLRRDVADDVFQEAWSKIVNARDSYRPTARFLTFLFRVAHNCFIDYLRRNQRHECPVNTDPDQELSPVPDPETLTEQALQKRRLNRAMADLPQEQREAWLLYAEGGLRLDEIAKIAGVNRETAKSRIRYASRKLRDWLDDPCERPDLEKVGMK
jgi:RNA polymerase sigma-70 factor (ECF subfamily)